MELEDILTREALVTINDIYSLVEDANENIFTKINDLVFHIEDYNSYNKNKDEHSMKLNALLLKVKDCMNAYQLWIDSVIEDVSYLSDYDKMYKKNK